MQPIEDRCRSIIWPDYFESLTLESYTVCSALVSLLHPSQTMDSFSCQKYFLSLNFLLLLMLLPATNSISFNFSTFPTNLPDIKFEEDAFVTHNSLQITKNPDNTNRSYSLGRATYKHPILLYESTKGRSADFTTHFSFIIRAYNHDKYGDGLTFFLAPFDSTIPPNSYGGALGLFSNDKAIIGSSGNQIVAVEFDSYQNEWDPSSDHVGIDVNSVVSVKNFTWGSSMKDGTKGHAWVSYNSNTHNLSVFLTYADNPVFSGNSTLWHVVDLRKILPNKVRVGFSASTFAGFETHSILSWGFNSTLESETIPPTPPLETIPPKPKDKKNKGVISGLLVGLFGVLTLGLGIFLFICWKKKVSRKEKDEDMDVELEKEFERGTVPKKFTYVELSRATNNFSEGRKLGEGGFGCVYRGFLSDLNIDIAVKRVSRTSKQGRKEYASEVKIISRLRHKNLVQLIGWCHEKGELLLVYEYMPNGSLDCHLFKSEITLTWSVRYKVSLELASALLYLHEEWEQCVIHRDIKSSNIMLDSNFSMKLGDFGLARLIDPELGPRTTGLAGTLGYMAPEYINTGKASKESDVYSFGVVILEIATGRKTRDARNGFEMGLVEWVWNLYGEGRLFSGADEKLGMEFDESQVECLMVVGLWCAHPDNKSRPSIRQAIQVLNFETAVPSLPAKMPIPVYQAPIPLSISLGDTVITNSNITEGR